MTYKEAIKTIQIAKAEVEWNYPMDYVIAFDKAIEALEKQIPKKPTKKIGAECGMHHKKLFYHSCPTCGKPVEVDDDEYWDTICYPTCECGQRIDWE